MIFNLGSTAPVYELQIAGVPGAAVTVSNTKKTYSQITDAYGNAVFRKLKKGLWSVIVRKDSEEASYSVNVGRNQSNALNINAIPEFSYNGSYQIVDDNGNAISSAVKNWKIRLLSGGNFSFRKLNNAVGGIDVFCVGGGGGGSDGKSVGEYAFGGGGGGGGYTATRKAVPVKENALYGIDVGAGGAPVGFYDNQSRAGTTSAFGVTAGGGYSGHGRRGGSGGSGGGSSGFYGMIGGTNGSNGASYSSDGQTGGSGQGTSTKEFGTGGLYSYGGNGGSEAGDRANGTTAANNTGNGGGGGHNGGDGGSGGSGIVVIRNAR